MTKVMMTVKDAAGRLGIQPDTLYRWARAGHINFTRYGTKLIRFSEEDLEEYLDRGKVRSRPVRKTTQLRTRRS